MTPAPKPAGAPGLNEACAAFLGEHAWSHMTDGGRALYRGRMALALGAETERADRAERERDAAQICEEKLAKGSVAAFEKIEAQRDAALAQVREMAGAFGPIIHIWKEMCANPDDPVDDDLVGRLHPIMRAAARALASVKASEGGGDA